MSPGNYSLYLKPFFMSTNGSGTSNWVTWLSIFAVAAIAAFFVVNQFFPQIIEQLAAGIVAFFAFLVGLIFRKRKAS